MRDSCCTWSFQLQCFSKSSPDIQRFFTQQGSVDSANHGSIQPTSKQNTDTHSAIDIPSADEKTCEMIQSFGTVVNVPQDGNCGYHVIQKGIPDLNKQAQPLPMTSFHRMLQQFAECNKTNLLKSYSLAFSTKEKESNWWTNNVLKKKLHKQGVNYDIL